MMVSNVAHASKRAKQWALLRAMGADWQHRANLESLESPVKGGREAALAMFYSARTVPLEMPAK
jgi:hypothetical protein